MQLQVENSIWHAFDYLAVETGRHCASKSKLKVIITSIPIIITLTILNEFLCGGNCEFCYFVGPYSKSWTYS